MSLPKVVIKDQYQDFLNGAEVKAILVDSVAAPLHAGAHVLAFKDTLAAATDVPVPKQQQSHYIGVEGTVTQTEVITASDTFSGRQHVLVRKV